MIFVNSMSDLFHEGVPDNYIERVFHTMENGRQHTFQVLTKRSNRMSEWVRRHYTSKGNGRRRGWPSNVWLGVSVENEEYKWRIDDLQKTPASTRFLSLEPLLGRLNLNAKHLKNIHWVIAGGESGPGARAMKPEWVRLIRDTCNHLNVPFFFKQWGAYDAFGKRMGKKSAGRILDGRTWDELPV